MDHTIRTAMSIEYRKVPLATAVYSIVNTHIMLGLYQAHKTNNKDKTGTKPICKLIDIRQIRNSDQTVTFRLDQQMKMEICIY